ncbi:hypothetical protein V2J09_004166 [Rumex salicifolius]
MKREGWVMTAPSPNMATLERSLRNCSLNHTSSIAGLSRSNSSSDAPDFDQLRPARYQPCQLLDLSSASSETTTTTTTLVDLNSHVSLPYHWEQCLDLQVRFLDYRSSKIQTGEVYYKNWTNGMKAKEDPRLVTTSGYSSTEEEEDDEDDEEEDEAEEESYDSEGSSTSNSYGGMVQMRRNPQLHADDVLVVAGCKSCLMYYMVPKQVLRCPKCTGQLLHFDRPDRD